MNRLKYILLLLSVVVGISACSDQQKILTQQEKDSNAFIKEIEEGSEYTPYRFLNEDYLIYYKEIKNAPEENRDVRPLQNSKVRVIIAMENAQTRQVLLSGSEQVITIFGVDENARSMTRGLQIALQCMEVGDEWEVIVPWQLGYGSYTYLRDIPAYTNLKYHLTLLEIIQ